MTMYGICTAHVTASLQLEIARRCTCASAQAWAASDQVVRDGRAAGGALLAAVEQEASSDSAVAVPLQPSHGPLLLPPQVSIPDS